MSIKLAITGMTCGGYANSVTRALRGVPGVADVAVDLAKASATIEVATGAASPTSEALLSALDDAGFGGSIAPPAAA